MRRLMRKITLSTACLLAMTLFFASCEKDDNDTQGGDIQGKNTPCVLQPSAVSIAPFGGSTPATRASVAMKEEQRTFNIGEELGNIITLGNSPVEDTPQTRAFASGTYYRIVVYKKEDWNNNAMKVLEQRLCKIGSTAYVADFGDSTEPIYLDMGSYKIFCYSFNKTTTDKMGKLADGAANVALADGDDFLSVVRDLTITGAQLGTNVSLGAITLQRRCCRLIGTLTTVAFTTNGIAASPEPKLSVTSTFNTAGNWSIKESSFTGTATSSDSKAFTLDQSGNDYSGTLLLLPLTNKALSATYNFTPNGGKNINISNKSIVSSTTFSPGCSYSFIIKAAGAYVLTDPTDGWVQIGSYKWAYANLDAATHQQETYPWVSGQINGSDNDYWRWNVLNVDTSSDGSYATDWNISNDPCIASLGSSWRVPSTVKLKELSGYLANSTRVHINGYTATTEARGGWFSAGNVVGCVYIDRSLGTCLFLPAAGYREGSSYSSVGTYGHYWGSTCWSNTIGQSFGEGLSLTTAKVLSYTTRISLTSGYAYPIRCSQ